MIRRIVAILAISLVFSVSADVRFGNRIGVGTRAFSLANNYTAVANDLSAVYWNPAALAFLPVREFQVTIDGFRNLSLVDVEGKAGSGIDGSKTEDYRERIRLANIGVMSALPTVQGGFTLAASYQTPYSFDHVHSFSYDKENNGTVETLGEDLIKYGDLRMWSAAFGVQVAPGLSVGLSGSLITGKEHYSLAYNADTYDSPFYEENIETSLTGYDFRGGVLYNPNNRFRLGMRVVVPQMIRFTEKLVEADLMTDDTYAKTKYESTGTMKSAPSGSMGVGFTFPWLTVSAEGRFTMPYTFVFPGEVIPESSQAKYFKLGGGIGIEVPFVIIPAMVRLGYSYDEYDLHDYVWEYDDFDIEWSENGTSVEKNKQTFTAGLGFVSSGTGVELTYGYQMWGLTHENGNRILNQDYDNHRAAVTLIVRY